MKIMGSTKNSGDKYVLKFTRPQLIYSLLIILFGLIVSVLLVWVACGNRTYNTMMQMYFDGNYDGVLAMSKLMDEYPPNVSKKAAQLKELTLIQKDYADYTSEILGYNQLDIILDIIVDMDDIVDNESVRYNLLYKMATELTYRGYLKSAARIYQYLDRPEKVTGLLDEYSEIQASIYSAAVLELADGDYEVARALFELTRPYGDSINYIHECDKLMGRGEFNNS